MPSNMTAEQRAKHRERMQAYREANRELAREQSRLSMAASRARLTEGRGSQKQASKAKRLGQFVHAVYRAKVLERTNGVCHICCEPVDRDRWDIDHIVPIDKGGIHSYANTAPSHPACNQAKRLEIRSGMPELLADALEATAVWHGR